MRDIATLRRSLVEESARDSKLKRVVKLLDEVSKNLGELATNIPNARVEWPAEDRFALIFDIAMGSKGMWDILWKLEQSMGIRFQRVGTYQQAFLPDGSEISLHE